CGYIRRGEIDQMTGCNGNGNGNSSASTMGQQTVTEKKFGGIAPKKPLISKDHERAYFDSADWVLGKQAASNNAQAAAIESLKPKLKRGRPITSSHLASRPARRADRPRRDKGSPEGAGAVA
uniref:Negatively light-regulated protein n=1 Tax=Aegilops tauschii subsp. strangulata TaxID=200361 RepID=A0A453ALE4_AEGTS